MFFFMDRRVLLLLVIFSILLLSDLATTVNAKNTHDVVAIETKKEPLIKSRGESVTIKLIDKSIENLTWISTPENIKKICSSVNYPDVNSRNACINRVLLYQSVEVPFVKIQIEEYLDEEGDGKGEKYNCVFTGQGTSFYNGLAKEESFTNLKVGKDYEGIYRVDKNSRNWNKIAELDKDFCKFGLPGSDLYLASGIHSTSLNKKISNFLVSFLSKGGPL